MLKISSQLVLLLPLALGIGIAMSVQTALNTQLRDYLDSPLQAAFFSFLIGTIVLGVFVMFQDAEKPSISQLFEIPWFLWLGGFLGVYAISLSIYTAPKLGFLTLSGLIIFGQIAMSMLLDHFGWLGTDKVPVNWQRLIGALMIFIGVTFTFQR
ncbi:transporter family-2 protein [Acinetobacter baylyi]|uniref:Transporter family-2 protein n=1 Tax=Acinetobacter baylyi TaxID=202950 RepID=A0ABU0UZF6_ACIBI|nr:DMT family transporter [Acinetobacter baylyi]MDQ1209623.1 transporter family-2 protein [Acinetobacter baylyi]MDR6106781.1 transporter family-2 protein [Acinetobacter baylyi]MDR6186494.1 transporter family-2 protein [Acinetobacter baylyi]